MTDDLDEGHLNEIRRHAKRMHTNDEYRERYCRLDFYTPNLRQKEFHNSCAREVMLRAGNQIGKTHAAGAHMAMAALGRWPDNWYRGHRFPVPKIERPHEFVGWAGCTTQDKTRDGIQLKLLGDFMADGGLGSGLLPLDSIIRVSRARGVSEFADTITMRRDDGKTAIVRLKTFGEGREAGRVSRSIFPGSMRTRARSTPPSTASAWPA